jgi:hypothetical protein
MSQSDIVFTAKKYPKATGLACPRIAEYNDHKKERKSIPLMITVLTAQPSRMPPQLMVIIHDYWLDDNSKSDFFTLGAEKFRFVQYAVIH